MIPSLKTANRFFEDILLYPSSKVYEWETTLVVAPHPEDESLGCGGAIALLRHMGYRVHVLYFTHGSEINAEKPAATNRYMKPIKTKEAINALAQLGMSEDAADFLHVSGGLVPHQEEAGFEELVRLCLNKLESFLPDTVVLPYRYHPYKDHDACWEIMQAAVRQMPYPIRVIEYMLWKGEKAGEIITPDTMKPWRLDIKSVMEQKIKSIAEHRTQKDDLIRWNQSGLSSSTSKRNLGFAQPWETYLESKSQG